MTRQRFLRMGRTPRRMRIVGRDGKAGASPGPAAIMELGGVEGNRKMGQDCGASFELKKTIFHGRTVHLRNTPAAWKGSAFISASTASGESAS